MAYHKYPTEGFILGSHEYGEASKLFFLLTEEFGVIKATASGVRKESSKLRHALQTYAHGAFEVVRGKDMWRIVGATPALSHDLILKDASKRALYARMAALVARYVIGEGEHQKIFYDMRDVLMLLSDDMTQEDIVHAEQLWNLRLLRELGYVRDGKNFSPIVASQEWTREALRALSPFRKEVLHEINSALKAAEA